MLIDIITVSESSVTLKDVIDILPTEKSFAQNIIDRLSIAGKVPMTRSSVVLRRSTSKPVAEIKKVKAVKIKIQNQDRHINGKFGNTILEIK